MGAVSPFGRGTDLLMSSLEAGRSGVRHVSELETLKGMRTQVAAIVPQLDVLQIPRKFRRSMSPMAIFATLACQDALKQAGLGAEDCATGELGVSIGSTVGSPNAFYTAMKDFFSDCSFERLKSTFFLQIMSHSCAANVAQTFGIAGRILAPSAACATGCQAIGYGYEMIAMGKQQQMLCGGADEFHPMTAAVFDIINAISTGYNDRPSETPRPFDRDRDGLVCGEGSGVLLLESLESARQRGAAILGEVVGFATLADPTNIANPNAEMMEKCMRTAVADAGLEPDRISYVNAHATATEQGDRAESRAIHQLFGSKVPVSSLKGHLGHTMAASGALELVASVEMMARQRLIPTLNLNNVDPQCAPLNYIMALQEAHIDVVIKNNFALGGVNSSIIVRRYKDD
jgi:3-oxoacyl-[acyl-carrier-protein] synthase II